MRRYVNIGFSVTTHVSPRELFNNYGVARVQDYEGSVLPDILGSESIARYWYNTTFDFVISEPRVGEYHNPLLVVEFDGVGQGCIQSDGRYHAATYLPQHLRTNREWRMNQKIEWCRQYGIPLLIVPPQFLEEYREVDIDLNQGLLYSIADIAITQILQSSSHLSLMRDPEAARPHRQRTARMHSRLERLRPYSDIRQLIYRYMSEIRQSPIEEDTFRINYNIQSWPPEEVQRVIDRLQISTRIDPAVLQIISSGTQIDVPYALVAAGPVDLQYVSVVHFFPLYSSAGHIGRDEQVTRYYLHIWLNDQNFVGWLRQIQTELS
jgi:hypothetical protein